MAKLTIGQKANRLLRFLMALRNPRIVAMLSRFGFTQADLDEGWDRLRAVSGTRMNTPRLQVNDPRHLDALDAWENLWYPIADASLKFRHPEVHGWLFLNLSQTSGLAVALSVGTLIERLDALEAGSAPLPADEMRAAMALLKRRGLDAARMNEARELLSHIVTMDPAPAPDDSETRKAQLLQAEDALWAYYSEWSQVARVAIADGRLLQQLFGVKRPGGNVLLDADEEGLGVDEDLVENETDQ